MSAYDELKETVENHGSRITALELDNREIKTDIRNLIKSVNNLVSTLKWGFGIIVTVTIFALGRR